MPCHALPCGGGRFSRGAIDTTCPQSILLLVRRTLRELGWPRIPGIQHRHNRWPRRIPPSMVEHVVRRHRPGEEPCAVCADTQRHRSETDQRAAGEIPACSPLARSFTMDDARCPLRRPAATGSGNQPRCMQILKMNMDDAETTQKRCTVTEDYEYQLLLSFLFSKYLLLKPRRRKLPQI